MGEPQTEAFNDEITLRQPEQRTPHAELHYLQSIRRIGIILPFYTPTCNPPPTLTKLGKSSWARPMTPKMKIKDKWSEPIKFSGRLYNKLTSVTHNTAREA